LFILPRSRNAARTRAAAGIELHEACDHAQRDAVPAFNVSSGMMVDRTTLAGCGAGRCQRPESAMLTQYPCFARRVNRNSEKA
jgi:hypothetical protein